MEQKDNNNPIIGLYSGLANLHETIKSIAPVNVNALLVGETGTGKELLADLIHDLSERRDKNIIKINCAALPDALLESELFGHVKGAFTGAHKDKMGKIELAHGGTLFLDEIGEMKPELQAKLLRVLQTKGFSSIGSNKVHQIDFRLISATNIDLKAAVKAKRFRSDLYYRLCTFPLHVPPLRDRKQDIPLLIDHFSKANSEKTGVSFKEITPEAMKLINEYNWPGNIRELENVVFQALVYARNEENISQDIIKELIRPNDNVNYHQAILMMMQMMITMQLDFKDINKDLIKALFEHYNNDVNLIAEKTILSKDRIYRYKREMK